VHRSELQAPEPFPFFADPRVSVEDRTWRGELNGGSAKKKDRRGNEQCGYAEKNIENAFDHKCIEGYLKNEISAMGR